MPQSRVVLGDSWALIQGAFCATSLNKFQRYRARAWVPHSLSAIMIPVTSAVDESELIDPSSDSIDPLDISHYLFK